MSGIYSQDLEDDYHAKKLKEYLDEEYPDEDERKDWRHNIEEGKPSIDREEG